MDQQVFSKQKFVEAGPEARAALSVELERVLSDRLAKGTDFHRAIIDAIAWLRTCGHDLWSLDADDDMEAWGPNYSAPFGSSLFITFRSPSDVEVEWSVRD